uniref:Uncharacterized protein n=1 Tax=Cucumis sativus TaxID=3659 RepID=A0A0A0K3Z3_CUCSA
MFCDKRVDDSNLCMLNWIVDTHQEWKELAERVFDTNQFVFKGLFPDEDVMEGNMFHGTETKNFEKGEYSKESARINTQIHEDEDRDGGNGERDDGLVDDGEDCNTENINMDEEGDKTTIVNSENEAARDGQN